MKRCESATFATESASIKAARKQPARSRYSDRKCSMHDPNARQNGVHVTRAATCSDDIFPLFNLS